MKLFACDHCGHTIYFENVVCEQCGHALGYVADANAMVSLEKGDNGAWHAPHLPERAFLYCANAEHAACNWLVDYNPGGDPFCTACRHNETIPPLDQADALRQWQTIERAKKRLFYSLLRLNLPLATRNQDPQHGLSFRFLSEAAATGSVMTGHDNGIITIALAEADDAAREYRRTQLNEPYRTLLGHFRHEIGHHYWDLLVGPGGPMLDTFRALFGDERASYQEALDRHYAQGAPEGWQGQFISAYATMHPWEDFAETWAHYLHLVDTVEMASAFGVRTRPKVDQSGELTTSMDFSPYRITHAQELIDHWVPLASLLNNLNRAVGQPDAYPFVLAPPVIEKLEFIRQLVNAPRP